MRLQKNLFKLLILISLFMFAQTALATPSASILYDETDVGGGYWQYDYTFFNTSTSENLYGVRLEFSGSLEVTNPTLGASWEGMWGNLSPTIFLETHSTNNANDIAAGNELSGFSFRTNSQIGNVAYTTFFDDHNSGRSLTTDITASNVLGNVVVVPEPVSTVLFLTGGATMAFRYRQKKKRQPT